MNATLATRWLLVSAFVTVGWATGTPTIVWQVSGEGRGTPAVDDSTVYLATKRHEVVALDSTSGRERWRQSTRETGDATFGFNVLVAGSHVAVGDYNVIGFDRTTGAMKWRFRPSEGHAPGPYLGVASGNWLLAGSAAGRLHAIDSDSGRAVWSAAIGTADTTVFQPITDGQRAYAGFTQFTAPNSGGMAAVDLKTGAVAWKTSFPAPNDRTLSTNWSGGPVLHENLVIAGCGDGNIYAFDLASGEIRWSIAKLDKLPPPNIISADRDMRPLAISGNKLVSGSLTGVVAAYDLSSRKELWRFYSQRSGSTVFRITADDRHVFVPYFSGELIALDASTGTERWRIGDWKAGFMWVPLIWKSRVYAAASAAGFYAFAITSGE